MTARLETILLIPWQRPSLQYFCALYHSMAERGDLGPVFLAHEPWMYGLIQEQKLSNVMVARLYEYGGGPGLGKEKGTFRTLEKVKDRVLPQDHRLAGKLAGWLQRRRNQAKKMLSDIRPRFIVADDDRRFGVIPIIQAAKEMGLPVVLLPYAIPATQSNLILSRPLDVEYRADFPAGRALRKRILRKHPQQAKDSRHTKVFFYRPPEIMALRKVGMMPSNPWPLGGESVARVLVSGDNMRKVLIADGTDPAKITVTGDLFHDDLYQAASTRWEIRDLLEREHHLDSGAKMIICSVPQYAERTFLSLREAVPLTKSLFSSLSQVGANLVLSFHPKTDPERYRSEAEALGVAITARPLREILPAADLFVATYSSTVLWAALVGIPVLVADLLAEGLDSFQSMAGVKVVKSLEDLAVMARKLLYDKDLAAKMSRAQKEYAREIAPLDGRAGDRIAESMLSLCRG